jgi:hypothetical protein
MFVLKGFSMNKRLLLLYSALLGIIACVLIGLKFNLNANTPHTLDILKHAEVMQELKKLEKTKINKEPHQHNTPGAIHPYTQSESYLRMVFDNYDTTIPQTTLDYYIDYFLAWAGIEEKSWGIYRPTINQVLENEKKYSSDYVFYHGYKQELGIVFDIYKEIFNFFNISAGSEQTILMRDIMKPRSYKYTNATEFLDFWPTTQFYKDQIIARENANKKYQKKYPGEEGSDDQPWLQGWNDSKDPLRTLLLSANISLFGNAGDEHSNTLAYFVHSKSFTETSKYLESFFKVWKFDKKYLKEIDELQKLLGSGASGHLLQIFIPKEQVNNMVYISGIYGVPFPEKINSSFDEQKKRNTDALSVLELYRNNPSAIVTQWGQEEYDYLQHRNGGLDAYAEHDEYAEHDAYAEHDLYSESSESEESYTPAILNTPAKLSIDPIQARILLTPQLFDPASNIKMFRYSLTPDTNVEEYNKRLKNIVRNMLADWLNDPSNKEYFKKLNLPLTKLTEYMKADKPAESTQSIPTPTGIPAENPTENVQSVPTPTESPTEMTAGNAEIVPAPAEHPAEEKAAAVQMPTFKNVSGKKITITANTKEKKDLASQGTWTPTQHATSFNITCMAYTPLRIKSIPANTTNILIDVGSTRFGKLNPTAGIEAQYK